MRGLLDIVIVNWNTGGHLAACLHSISTSEDLPSTLNNVVIVDNASDDPSMAGVEYTGLPLVIIRNNSNRGFAAACNQGAKHCFGKYILFLNPDTMIGPASLSVPVAFLEEPKNYSYAACGIQLRDENNVVSRSCARIPGPRHFLAAILGLTYLFPDLPLGVHMTDWSHLESRDVDHVMGAFYLVRRDIFEELGGFDERYFVYLEDLDLSYRVRHTGNRIRYMTETCSRHIGGGSSSKVKSTRLFYSLQSRILYGYKHFGVASATGLLLATLFWEIWPRLVRAVLARSLMQATDILKGYAKLFTAVPAILRTARQ